MILITGATGFLGSELVYQLLENGARVRAIKREGSAIPKILQGKPVEWVTADILDHFALEAAFEGVRQVYHCAGMISFKSADRKRLHQVNAEGTANVVNLCLENNIGKLVHVSSVAAIGEGKPGQAVTEKDLLEYTGLQHGYSISKYEGEMEVWRGIAEGLTAVIVNPAVIIGRAAGDKGSGRIFETARRGTSFYTGGSIGLIAVADVARVMIALMNSDISGQRFILNAGTLSIKELFTQAAAIFGNRAPSILVRPWMLKLALVNRSVVHSLTKQHLYSTEKINEALPGIVFRPVSEVVNETCIELV
ncbi:SDR family NAD(P)-dependent oxidoreductase [Hufsiella ginkgonis]|uniref:SDR family NAD(P)-dependent oxidoreductase n=1 Tax=Hufsiella ginkgonis TaxID=2695274 RepID=A0A7K1XTZ8_9SPHI|nr:SDR family NAD(P)-dependent oxidoreductase [Hufsiella ginkgonis]MXV14454.1 SDR family NAD(P)-dependent oxidoreductase [Hufsiella ginkgonis]